MTTGTSPFFYGFVPRRKQRVLSGSPNFAPFFPSIIFAKRPLKFLPYSSSSALSRLLASTVRFTKRGKTGSINLGEYSTF